MPPPVTFKNSWFQTKIHKPNPLFTNIDEYISGSLNNGLYPRLCNGDLFQFSSMISFTLGICRLKSPIPGNLRPKASSHQMTMPKNLIWIYYKLFPNRNVRKNINYNLLKWPVMILTIGIPWFYIALDESYSTYSGSWIYYCFQSQEKIYWIWVNLTFRLLSVLSFNDTFWIRFSSIKISM